MALEAPTIRPSGASRMTATSSPSGSCSSRWIGAPRHSATGRNDRTIFASAIGTAPVFAATDWRYVFAVKTHKEHSRGALDQPLRRLRPPHPSSPRAHRRWSSHSPLPSRWRDRHRLDRNPPYPSSHPRRSPAYTIRRQNGDHTAPVDPSQFSGRMDPSSRDSPNRSRERPAPGRLRAASTAHSDMRWRADRTSILAM